MVQWLRIHLPMQRTRVPALVREDPTCLGATNPVRNNYWACTLEPTSHNYWARMPRARAPQQEKPPQWEARALQRRVAPARRQLEKNPRTPTKTQRGQKQTNKQTKKRLSLVFFPQGECGFYYFKLTGANLSIFSLQSLCQQQRQVFNKVARL